MMKVQISVVGIHPRPTVVWPEGWPVPREGETIAVDGHLLLVRTVTWYPYGEDDDLEAFVYVVAGTRRPS